MIKEVSPRLQEPRQQSRLKIVYSEAKLKVLEENLTYSSQRVTGELGISSSSMSHYIYGIDKIFQWNQIVSRYQNIEKLVTDPSIYYCFGFKN